MENVDLLEPVEQTETLDAEQADFNKMNKEDLVRLCEAHQIAVQNYEARIAEMKKHNEDSMKELNDYYSDRFKKQNNLISYYERKFKVLNDILNIETGGEK